MRPLILLLLASSAAALDNAHRFTERTGSTQSGRILESHVFFPAGEIPNYPQPYILGGAAITPWQSSVEDRWPDGSVKRAMVFYSATLPASSVTAVEFRNSANPCSSGIQSACDAAGLDQTAMLAFNGGSWDFSMQITPVPVTGTAAVTKTARSMMASGHWRYLYRGPVLTRVRAGDVSTSRADDFGWRNKRKSAIKTKIVSSDAFFDVVSAHGWNSYARPYKLLIEDTYYGNEVVSVCYIDESINRVYVGTTNGTSGACASNAGRGQDGTGATNYALNGNVTAAIQPTARTTAAIPDQYATSMPVDSVAGFTTGTPFYIEVMREVWRICNISGSNLIAGSGAWGCAGDTGGRQQWGSTVNGIINGHFVYKLAGDYWEDAPVDSYKSLHPEFELDFWTGWSGVGCQYLLYNTWADRLQDQRYDYVFQQGTTTVASNTQMIHRAATIKIFPVVSTANNRVWNGAAPGEVKTDLNHPWLKYSGVLPYDPTVTLTAAAITQELTGIDSTQAGNEYGWDHASHIHCEMDSMDPAISQGASWIRPFVAPGGRPEIGLLHRSFATATLSWASTLANAHRLNEKAYGLGSCFAQIPIFNKEGTVRNRFYGSPGKFCQGGAYTANTHDTSCSFGGSNYTNADSFNRPPSLDVRPSNGPYSNAAYEQDLIMPVGLTTTGGYALSEVAHFPSGGAYFPWLMTGSTIMKEMQQMSASSREFQANISAVGYSPNAGADNNDLNSRYQYRFGAWGWIARSDHLRFHAWGLREVVYAAYASDGGSPEKEYFTSKLSRIMAMEEGAFNLTNGSFYTPCPSPLASQYDYSPWCAGRHYKGMNAPVFRTKIVYGDTFFGDWNAFLGDGINVQRTRHLEGDWMYSYWYIILGQAENLGFSFFRPTRVTAMERLLGHLKQSTYNPFRTGAYSAPETPCLPEGVDASPDCGGQVHTQGTQLSFSTFANEMMGFSPGLPRTNNYFCSAPSTDCGVGGGTDNDFVGGFSRIVNGAAAWLPDGVTSVDEVTGKTLTGRSAWDWMNGNVKYKNLAGDNPAWIYSPPNSTLITNLRQTGTNLLFVAPDGGSCSYAVNPVSSSSSVDTPVSGSNLNRSVSLAGRTFGDLVRITCGFARTFWTVQ